MADDPPMLSDLRPPAVLSVGVTGHRSIGDDKKQLEAIEDSLTTILKSLQGELMAASKIEAAFFSSAVPKLRVITMGASGADIVGMRAARTCRVEMVLVLPFPWEVYRKDFDEASLSEASQNISDALYKFELPGTREEGARAYERANDVILSNVDILLAVWDGERAKGRAGTGDVVQAAIARRLPVIVINPSRPIPEILRPPVDLDPHLSNASDLPRRPLGDELSNVITRILCPPQKTATRQGLIDFLAEKPRSSAWRFEYPLLLSTFVGPKARRNGPGSAPRLPDFATREENLPAAKKLGHVQAIFDKLAVEYGQLHRSSAVSRYLLVVLGTFVSGVVGLLVPALSGAAIVVQVIFNILVILDTSIGVKRRWHERWLDYRVVAQRLNWVAFLHPMGLGTGPFSWTTERGQSSWTEWYIRRTTFGLDPPTGSIDVRAIETAKARLTQHEIPHQLAYHRLTFRQLQILEARLSLAARMALLGAIIVALLLGAAAWQAGSLSAVGWKPLAMVLLAILPATMTGFNGIRADSDLVRLVERSAQTIAVLARIRRTILASPPTYDSIASSMLHLAAIMGHELKEWQFVLQSRRSRVGRHRAGRKSIFRRMIPFLK